MCGKIKFIKILMIAFIGLYPTIASCQHVTEKIFLASDRMNYGLGDTISLFGQICPTDTLNYSRYLYVELITQQDSILLRNKLKSDDKGRFSANLPVETYWQQGTYNLRAYTRLMQNFNPLSFPSYSIQIGQQKQDSMQETKEVRCLVYPEGGKVLSGIPQVYTLAFFDADRNPYQIPFHIVCNGDTLLHKETTSSGFQQVRLALDKNKQYQVLAKVDDEHFEYVFPACEEGSTLQVIHSRDKALVRILRSERIQGSFHLYSYHDQLGMQEIDCSSQDMALVNTKEVPSGCLSFFLTDDSCRILSERTVYVDADTSLPTFQIEKVYLPESELDFSSFIQDSMTVYARILPEGDQFIPTAETALKWTSSLDSPLPFPMNYYKEPEEERRTDLQAWLSTALFSRFDVQKALTEGFKYSYPYEDILILKGGVTDENGLKIKKGQVNLLNTSNGKAYLCTLDDKGLFETAVDDFQDGDEFFVSALKGNQMKAGFYKYQFEDESYPAVAKKKLLTNTMEKNGKYEVEYHLKDTMHYGINKNNVLPEIKVKARVKQPKYVPTKKFYANNYIDVANNEERFPTFSSIIDAMPYVEIVCKIDYQSKQKKYEIITTARGGGGLVVLVDGTRTEPDEVIEYSPAQIESVELLSAREALLYTFGAIDGALLITTRKLSKSGEEVQSKGILYRPMGISNLEQPFVPISKIKLPSSPGRYNLLIDCISSNNIFSYEFPIRIE